MKTWFKFAFTLNFVGWFAFMWLSAYGMNHKGNVSLVIALIGLFCCLISGIAFTLLTHNRGFWMKNDELDKCIEKHKQSIRGYEAAKEKLIRKIQENK